MNGFDRNLFDQYNSMLPGSKPANQPMPPEGIVVLAKCPSLHPKEFEAMVTRAYGRSGLRWQVFNIRGRAVSYPYRGWQPDSWRFKGKKPE